MVTGIGWQLFSLGHGTHRTKASAQQTQHWKLTDWLRELAAPQTPQTLKTLSHQDGAFYLEVSEKPLGSVPETKFCNCEHLSGVERSRQVASQLCKASHTKGTWPFAATSQSDSCFLKEDH